MADERDSRREDVGGERDAAVGDLLRAVAVPEHGHGYWEALDARLDAEEPAHAARSAGPAAEGRPAGEPEDGAREPRPGRRAKRWWRKALVAAAAACVVAAVAFGLPSFEASQPEPATAADVVARSVKALGDLRTASGVLVERHALGDDPGEGHVESSTRFWLSDDGSWAQTGPAEGPEAWGEGTRTLAFDAGAARLVEIKEWAAGGTPSFTEWRDAPIGTPDGALVESLRFRAFARVVDAFGGAELARTSHEDRPAWRLTAARTSGERWPAEADSIEVVIDEATAIPVRWTLLSEGEIVAEQRVEALALDEPVEASRFAPEPVAGAARRDYDAGYRRLTAAEVAAGLPFAAYYPASLPEGFVPRSAALARREWRDPQAGAHWEALALPAALFSWRRGFDELSVSVRPYSRSIVYEGEGVEPREVEDPFESSYAWLLMRAPARDVTLGDGALAGLEAHLAAGAWAYPHLWVVVPAAIGGEKLIVTVAGDATADELVAVAESLAPLD